MMLITCVAGAPAGAAGGARAPFVVESPYRSSTPPGKLLESTIRSAMERVSRAPTSAPTAVRAEPDLLERGWTYDELLGLAQSMSGGDTSDMLDI